MPRIRIEGTDIEFDCPEDEVLLRAALRSGLGFPYECNVGGCGNCRFELLEGEVEHEWDSPPAWGERDLKRNRWLGCQARALSDCRIKLRLDDNCVGKYPPILTRARLTEIHPLTHDISEFAFSLVTADDFLPGQYALLELPGVEGRRAYSMCNLPGHGEWRFQIKRVPGGAGTAKLFDELAVGDEIGIDGPYGMAWLRDDAPRDIVCIAGGSGLSPMISVARAAATSDRRAGRQVHFFYGGRAPRDICGEDMLAQLPGWGERIHYHAAISEEGHGDWSGPVSFVHEMVAEKLGESIAEHEVYFAGPPAMAQAVQKMLFDLKVPFDRVHFDQFY
jgi:toluene monooxygenase electron transfer component